MNRYNAVVGYAVAGITLIVVAGYAPKAAVALAGVIGLGVVLSHGPEVTQLMNQWAASLKPI